MMVSWSAASRSLLDALGAILMRGMQQEILARVGSGVKWIELTNYGFSVVQDDDNKEEKKRKGGTTMGRQ